MAGVRRFQDLIAWQQARELKKLVYQLTDRPICRREPTTRFQLRDAAKGPASHISEGFGRRRPRDFARFLTMARASLDETENHLIDGIDLGLWSEQDLEEIYRALKRTKSAIAGLQRYLNNCDPDFGAPNP
jgi:four helix bundle protein